MGTFAWLVMNLLHYSFRILYIVTSPIFAFLYESQGSKGLPPKSSEIIGKSAVELAKKIRRREVKSEEVVQAYINRILEVQSIVNAIIAERFDIALRKAREIDKILDSGNIPEQYSESNAPLLGLPFTAKEAFAIKGLPNSSGLLVRKDDKAQFDAEVICSMKAAGAIPIALTNVSELCMWMESSNLVYGRTNNAYHPGRMVGGSSGGEGCIVSTGGSVISVGSDIGGSIRMPAFFNGVFGHKPSYGIVSNLGQFPSAKNEAATFLSTGPICQFAGDLTPMLKVMAGPEDCNKLQLDAKVNVADLKFYYMEDDGGSFFSSPVHPEIMQAIDKAARHFAEIGAVVRKVNIKQLKYSFQIWATKMQTSGNESFCSLLGNSVKPINPYWELLLWILQCPRHTLPAIGLGLGEKVQGPAAGQQKMINMCDKLRDELQEMLGNDGVFLYPTHPLPAYYHNQPLLAFVNFAYTGIFNVLGLPATNVPMGLAKNERVPIGIQVIGRRFNDHLCLAVAEDLEKTFGGWIPPYKCD